MKKILFAMVLLSASLASAATKTSVVMYDGTLQAGTTGMHVSSGTIRNFRASTVTVTGVITASSLTVTNLSVTNLTAPTFIVSRFTTTDLQSTNLRTSTQTWKGFGVLPILQIQQYTTNTSSVIANTSFSLTTLSGSITPKLSTSKILVIANGNVACSGSGVCYATIYRDSTNLSSDGGFETHTAVANNHTTMTYYDSPGTTSAVTYSAQTRVNSGSASATFPGTDGGIYTTTAVLILAEIAQ